MNANPHTTTHPFDAADYLDNEQSVAAYLNEALAAGDMAHFQAALQTAARARAVADIAESAGHDPSPRFDTVQRALAALGVNLTIQPAIDHS